MKMTITDGHDSPVFRLVNAAGCLALSLVLPFLTGQIPEIGSALCPMHLPILLAGFLCGPWWAALAGAAAPGLRFVLFGMPPLPVLPAMTLELAAYGLVSGLLYRRLPPKTSHVYGSLIAAMLAGRVVWGCAMAAISGASGSPFTWKMFLAGAFVTAVPGIVLQLLLLPVVVLALRKAGYLRK